MTRLDRALPGGPISYAEIAAWAKDDIGAIDAASAKAINEFLKTLPARQRLAAAAVMRRKLQILARVAGRIDTLEDDLTSPSSLGFMDRNEKIRLYGALSSREATMMRLVDADEQGIAQLVLPTDTEDEAKANLPTDSLPTDAATRIVTVIDRIGETLGRASVRRATVPPVLDKWES